MKYFKTTVFALLPMMILLVVTESVLAILNIGTPFTLSASKGWSSISLMQPDKYVGARMKPNYSQNYIKLNSLGLRDNEIDQHAKVKILSLGDSCAFGWKIDNVENIYAHLLQVKLNREVIRVKSTGGVQVLDAGVPSYSVYNGLQLYLNYLKDSTDHWDFILATFGWNEQNGAEDLEFRLRNPPIDNVVVREIRDVAHHLRLYNAMEYLWFKMIQKSVSDPLVDAHEHYEKDYRQLVKNARDNGTRVVISAVITRPDDKSPLARHVNEFNDIARKVAQDEGAYWLDLNPLFLQHKNEIGWYDDWHYDEIGHKFVAEALFEKLFPLCLKH